MIYLRECEEIIRMEGSRKTKSLSIFQKVMHEIQMLFLNAFLELRIQYFKKIKIKNLNEKSQ